MAYESIDKIYEEIRLILLGLKLKEAKEYFDFDNIPDSLADNSFCLSPFAFSPGESIKTSTQIVIIGSIAGIKINLSMQLTANNIIQKLKSTMIIVTNIMKGILAITIGEDEKDLFTFQGAEPKIEDNKLIYEINFNLNYRIKNI